MTSDGRAMVASLAKAKDLLFTINDDLSTKDSDAVLWSAEMSLALIRDAVKQGQFIVAHYDNGEEARSVALSSILRAMDLCRVARKKLFWWERQKVVQQISIEIARAQEVMRRVDFYLIPHPDR